MDKAKNRFDELLGLFLEGLSSEAEHQELVASMKGHPERIAHYLDIMEIHAMLHSKGAAFKESSVLRSSPVIAMRERERSCDEERRASGIRPRFHWWKAAAAVVLLLGGLAGGLLLMKAPHLATIGDVAGTVSLTGADKGIALQGTRIYSGCEVAVNGGQSRAVIVWKDGTLLKLASGTRVMLTQVGKEKRIILLAGTLEGTFSKQQQGESFVILTVQGRATVLGTVLRVTVTPGDTRLAVIEGTVLFETNAGKHSAVVTGGYEVLSSSVEDGQLKVTRISGKNRFSGGRGGGPGSAARKQLSLSKEK
jgi:ferric-dicitrate binding protein FerR (iron transport regulator)